MLPHPREEIGIRCEPFAARKNSAEALPRALDQLAQKRIYVAVDISQERQIQRITTRGQSIDTNIFSGLIVENNKPCEMQRFEFRERYQVVVGIHATRRAVHRIKQLPKLHFTLRIDRRENHEGRLRSHGLFNRLLLEHLVSRRLVMRHVVHVMPQG